MNELEKRLDDLHRRLNAINAQAEAAQEQKAAGIFERAATALTVLNNTGDLIGDDEPVHLYLTSPIGATFCVTARTKAAAAIKAKKFFCDDEGFAQRWGGPVIFRRATLEEVKEEERREARSEELRKRAEVFDSQRKQAVRYLTRMLAPAS